MIPNLILLNNLIVPRIYLRSFKLSAYHMNLSSFLFKYLLSTNYIPGSILGAENVIVNKTEMAFLSWNLYYFGGNTSYKNSL